jgi:hypothetical protein
VLGRVIDDLRRHVGGFGGQASVAVHHDALRRSDLDMGVELVETVRRYIG